MNRDEVEELIQRCLVMTGKHGRAIGPKPYIYKYQVEDVSIVFGEFKDVGRAGQTATLEIRDAECKLMTADRFNRVWVHSAEWLQAEGAARVLKILREVMVLDDLAGV